MNAKSKTKRICQITAACIALMMVICMTLPALHADVIFEPRDKFYENNRDGMQYADKVYIATKTVNGYESPEDDDVLLNASEGQRLYISFVYTDENGVEWGVYDWDTLTCWFRLDELEPVYDTRDFILDHEPEFTGYADQLADLPLDGSEMPLWKYPGSAEKSGSVYLDEYFVHDDYAKDVYTDYEGRDWVYFPYVFAMEGWANAADPLNETPAVFDANAPHDEPAAQATPVPEITQTPTPTEEPEPNKAVVVEDLRPESEGSASRLGTIALIVIALLGVGFVMVVSVVLIVVLYVLNKKKKK